MDGMPEAATPHAPEAPSTRAGRIAAGESQVRESLMPADRAVLEEVLAPGRFMRLARRSFHNDEGDRWLFLLFATGGFAFVMAAKFLAFKALATEGTVIALLVTYAILSWTSPRFQLHPDRLGDNCYYMGFLFTLASLSGALLVLQDSSAEARGSLLESLLGSFGVALFSTIAGIAARVFFMQIHREIEDVEETIRRELQDSARLLKDQLGDAVSGLETFRLRTQQVMDEQFDSACQEFAAASRKLSEQVAETGNAHAAAGHALARSSEQTVEILAAAVTTTNTRMAEVALAHEKATDRLVGSAETLLGEVSRLVERVDAIEVPSDLLTRQVEDARQRIAALVGAMEDAAKADSKRQTALAKTATNFDAALARLAGAAPFDSIEKSAARLNEVVGEANAAVSELGRGLSSQSDVLDRLARQARDDATAIETARTALRSDLAESTAALRKLQGTLSDVAEGIASRLGTA